MTTEEISHAIQECGAKAHSVSDTAKAYFDDARERDTVVAAFVQAKMLGEIAYQLAEMNERDSDKIRSEAIREAMMGY